MQNADTLRKCFSAHDIVGNHYLKTRDAAQSHPCFFSSFTSTTVDKQTNKKHFFQVLSSIPSVLNGLLPTAHFLLLFFSGVRAVLEFSHCLFVSRFSSVIGVDVVFALFSNFLNSLHKWLNTVKLNIHICLLRSFLCFFRSFLWANASSHWLHLFCPFSTVRELCVSGLI